MFNSYVKLPDGNHNTVANSSSTWDLGGYDFHWDELPINQLDIDVDDVVLQHKARMDSLR